MDMAPGKAAMLAGQPAIPSTTSLDLPASLARLLTMDTFNPAAPLTQPAGLATTVSPMAMAAAENNPMTPHYKRGGAVGPGGYPLPRYADGGMVGPGGEPLPPPAEQTIPGAPVASALQQAPAVQQAEATPMAPGEMHTAISGELMSNPAVGEQIRGALMKALQSGELSQQQLNLAIQLIEAAVNNPAIYPQLRQFALQQGLATEEDIPPQYDRGFVMLLLTIAKSAQQLVQGGVSMQSMASGGNVRGPANAPVPIMAHEGEYVIPKHVVGMKGREFFDSLVKKYEEHR